MAVPVHQRIVSVQPPPPSPYFHCHPVLCSSGVSLAGDLRDLNSLDPPTTPPVTEYYHLPYRIFHPYEPRSPPLLWEQIVSACCAGSSVPTVPSIPPLPTPFYNSPTVADSWFFVVAALIWQMIDGAWRPSTATSPLSVGPLTTVLYHFSGGRLLLSVAPSSFPLLAPFNPTMAVLVLCRIFSRPLLPYRPPI